MKKLKSVICGAIIFASAGIICAKDNALSLYTTLDGAIFPKSMYKTEDAHFSPLTGPYQEAQARLRLHSQYKAGVPLGQHWLLKDASLSCKAIFEITPVSVRPMVSATFEPLPFFNVSAGASLGTGWKFLSFTGMRKMNLSTGEYENLSPFKDYYYDYWAGATFQFDTGAIIPGDWSHVVILANYQVINKTVSGLRGGSVGKWQGTENFVNGWQYDFTGVLAYQMPLSVYRAGIMVELYGYFDKDDFGAFGKKENYNGEYVNIVLSPMAQIHLSKKDDLTVLVDFASRRAFAEKHSKVHEEIMLHYIGNEWVFNRLALSWTHSIK